MKKRDFIYIISAILLVFWLISSHFSERILQNHVDDEKKIIAETGILSVHVQDVGNADSVFIQLPDGKTALIDGAERENADSIIDYIDTCGAEKIDYLIATHPHSDHIGGLAEIIESFEIGQVFMPNVVHTTSDFENMIDAIESKSIPVTQAKDGQILFEGNNYIAECFSPIEENYENLNDYSVILKLTYKDKSFLFTGDAEKDVEKAVVKKYGNKLKSDVLKVGHHGSNTSTCREFLKAVSPETGIISVGTGNDYGHPHKEVLERLEKFDVGILRTDKLGTVVIKTDGFDWRE